MPIAVSIVARLYIEMQRQRGFTADTVTTNARILRRWMASLERGDETPLAEIGKHAGREYIAGLQSRTSRWQGHPNHPETEGGLSVFTIRKEAKSLLAFGTWLEAEEHPNPLSTIIVPKQPKVMIEVLTQEDIAKIYATINRNTILGSRMHAMLTLMLDTGLRISEVGWAQMDDLDLDKRRLKVRGKGSKDRIVPFGSQTVQSLLRYIEGFRAQPRGEIRPVFTAVDGYPMVRGGLEQIFQRLRQSSGVPRLRGHITRHTFAVNYLMGGGDVRTLQMILGHETLEMTMKYLHLVDSQVKTRYESTASPMDRLMTVERRVGFRTRRAVVEEGD
jgi:site-specific recombinase XerD